MQRRSSDRQFGFTLVSAIFLLVVLTALGGVMLTFSTAQHTSSALDVRGSRAYQAARVGIEWGLYRTQVAGGGTSCPAAETTLPKLAGDLSDFTVVVTCDAVGYTESGTNRVVFVISSTASVGTPGSPNRVERRLEIRV